jgi:hypothetical protein
VNVDAFACGDAVCGGRRHVEAQYNKMRRQGWLGGFGYWWTWMTRKMSLYITTAKRPRIRTRPT